MLKVDTLGRPLLQIPRVVTNPELREFLQALIDNIGVAHEIVDEAGKRSQLRRNTTTDTIEFRDDGRWPS